MKLTGKLLKTEYANGLNDVRNNIINKTFESVYESFHKDCLQEANVNHSVLDQLEKIANDLEKKDFFVTTEDGMETKMTSELAKTIIISYQAIKKEDLKRYVQKLINQTQNGLRTYIEKVMNNVDIQSILKTRYMSGPGADNGAAV